MHRTLARLFDQWETEILRPVLVTLLTTILLVLGSLMFKPVRNFLFPPAEVQDYPLYCTAEPYARDDSDLGVDFFIVNLTGDEQTRDGLARFLRQANPDPTTPVSPDIHLRYTRGIGKVSRADLDQEFNADKGEIEVEATDDGNVRITPIRIEPRVIMKVSIVVEGVPIVPEITRATPLAVPFEEDYKNACYSR